MGRAVLVLGLVASGAAAEDTSGIEQDAVGFIYGTVETRGGRTYEGLLRWGTEEAFWDDLFHGAKDDLPYLARHRKERRSRITVFGVTVGYRWDDSSAGRLLVARFGDIDAIEPRGSDGARLRMKSGSTIEIDGGSNDVGGKVVVSDRSIGDVKLDWDRIERIVFAPAPVGVAPRAWRLHGSVKAAGETFVGYVQWDKQECLSTDKLDGESDDGDLAIDMGQIARIERRSSSSSRVILHDGREFVMRGTNDVNSDNRGIYVEDPRYGRVEIPWSVFESVDFRKVRSSGRGYADYRPLGPLAGTVTTREGTRLSGRLVFDLDETEAWEILNGSRNEVAYNIPFSMVRSVRPDRWDASRVVLASGIELLLEDGQDVSEKNAGVIVIDAGEGGRERFVAWIDVVQIDFD